MKKKLYRSSTDKMICGVLAGFAEYIDVDPTIGPPCLCGTDLIHRRLPRNTVLHHLRHRNSAEAV